MKFFYGFFGILFGGITLGCVIMTIPVYDMAVGGMATGKGEQLYYGFLLVAGAIVSLILALLCYRRYKRLSRLNP